MTSALRPVCGAMMFLQYFIWGAWFVTLGTYLGQTLGFYGAQIGAGVRHHGHRRASSLPFFVGMIADRFFATAEDPRRAAPGRRGAPAGSPSTQHRRSAAFYPLLLAYALCYMPTLALTNSLSFDHMTGPGKRVSRHPRAGHDRLDRGRARGRQGAVARGTAHADAGRRRRLGGAGPLLPCCCRTRRPRPPASRSRASATCSDSTRCSLLKDRLVRRVRHRLVPALHSAAVLLRLHQPVPERDRAWPGPAAR